MELEMEARGTAAPGPDPAKLAEAAELLLRAYAMGERGGGSVRWEDLDAAFEAAREALSGRYEEILASVEEAR